MTNQLINVKLLTSLEKQISLLNLNEIQQILVFIETRILNHLNNSLNK